MQLCFYLIKLSQNIFVGRKYKKKNTIQKTPSTIQRKIRVLLMCFQKNLQIILTQKKNPRHIGKDYQCHLPI